MLRRILRRLVPATLLVILAVPIGGVTYAYWRGSGAGSGSATTGTTTAVTLSPGTPSASLYPGGTANVVLTISNPNVSLVQIGSLTLDTTRGQGSSGFSVDAGHSACLAPALTFTSQTNGGLGWTVAASGNLQVTLSGTLSMGLNSASNCQGATFTVFLSAGP